MGCVYRERRVFRKLSLSLCLSGMYGLGEVSVLWKLWIPDWGSETSRICWRGQRAGEINIDSSAQKEYFLLKEPFLILNFTLHLVIFNENLPRQFSCPLNGVFDCFGAVRTPGNGIVVWVMTKETGIRQSKFCRSESGPRCKVFALRAFARFLSNSIWLWRFAPLQTLLVANPWSRLKKETMKKKCKGAIFKEILINCTFVTQSTTQTPFVQTARRSKPDPLKVDSEKDFWRLL